MELLKYIACLSPFALIVGPLLLITVNKGFVLISFCRDLFLEFRDLFLKFLDRVVQSPVSLNQIIYVGLL